MASKGTLTTGPREPLHVETIYLDVEINIPPAPRYSRSDTSPFERAIRYQSSMPPAPSTPTPTA